MKRTVLIVAALLLSMPILFPSGQSADEIIIWDRRSHWDSGTKTVVDGVNTLETWSDNPSVPHTNRLFVSSMYGDQFPVSDDDGETWRWLSPTDAAYSETADIWIAGDSMYFAANATAGIKTATRTGRTFIHTFDRIDISTQRWLGDGGTFTIAIVDTNANEECVFCGGWNVSSSAMGFGFNLTYPIPGYRIQPWFIDDTGFQECGGSVNAHPYGSFRIQPFVRREGYDYVGYIKWFGIHSEFGIEVPTTIAECDMQPLTNHFFIADFDVPAGESMIIRVFDISIRSANTYGDEGSYYGSAVIGQLIWFGPASIIGVDTDVVIDSIRIIGGCFGDLCGDTLFREIVFLKISDGLPAWSSGLNPSGTDITLDVSIDKDLYPPPYRFAFEMQPVDTPTTDASNYPRWVSQIQIFYHVSVEPPPITPPVGEVHPVISFVVTWVGPFLCGGILLFIGVVTLSLFVRFKKRGP